MKILYLSSFLPKRSETFVYNEVLGLESLGHDVGVASLYPPEKNLGEPALDDMAARAVPVYGTGQARLVRDATAFFFRHPIRGIQVMTLAKMDALLADDMRLRDRPKVVFQGLAGLALARRLSWHGHPAHAKISDTGRMPVLPVPRGTKYTHLHVHMAHAAATVGMYAARALGIPFSFTGHAADLFRERCLLKQKLRRAAFVACISEWHREWYRTIHRRPDAEYPVIRCGVAVPATALPPRSGPPLALLGLGRLVPKKGFDVLIEACRILAADGIELACVIAGDGPEMQRLKNLATGLPVTFPGEVANRDVPALLARADIFVLPCRISGDGDRDGIPVVLIEAMAHGLCAVSGDLPTIRELIRDNQSGRLVPPGDPSALAAYLRTLAGDPALRAALARSGRQRIEEEFSSAKNLDRLAAAFSAHHQP
ncbi:MAG: glycosyltransferase family 4 protein [Verrucomicrobiae bacterium]